MYAEHIEFEVVFSGAIERERIRSQQIHTAPPLPPSKAHAGPGKPVTPRIHSLRQTVLGFLRARPGRFFAAGEIALALGESIKRVHYTIGDLVEKGSVQRQSDVQGTKGARQRYAARL